MKKLMAALAMFLAVNAASHGQATPAAVAAAPRYNPGPNLPLIDGNIQYALSGSEIIQLGANGESGTSSTTSLSGDVEYLSTSAEHPFTMLYAGGVLFSSLAGQSTGVFQTLSISQGLVTHGWAMGVSDSVAYLPQSPTTGLSGIPGVGDLGLQPIADPLLPAQSVLTNYAKRVSNSLSGNIERRLSGRTSISGTGSYGILRFVGNDNSGLDSTQIGGQAGINYLLDRRSSVSANVQYSTFSYTSNASSFNTRGLNLQYSRQLTKTISMDASVGPQWVSGFEAEPVGTPLHEFLPGSVNAFAIVRPADTTTTTVPVPSRLGLATNVGLSIALKSMTAGISYSHGVNGGSGIQTGAIADNFAVSAQRTYGRKWSASITGAYTRTSGLVDDNISSSVYGGVQANRRLTSTLSAFLSYTGIHQAVDSTLAAQNAFNGFTQSFSIGITFAPRMARLGQF
jgi:hypothetical protein